MIGLELLNEVSLNRYETEEILDESLIFEPLNERIQLEISLHEYQCAEILSENIIGDVFRKLKECIKSMWRKVKEFFSGVEDAAESDIKQNKVIYKVVEKTSHINYNIFEDDEYKKLEGYP